MQAAPPGVAVIPVDEKTRKTVRTLGLINFVVQFIQLGASVAIICIVRYNLQNVTLMQVGPNTLYTSYECLMSSSWQGSCDYAYSLASVSIFASFLLSLFQCLTLDCCGMGRLVEVLFDCLGIAWWVAGGVTLAAYAGDAPDYGASYRAAVIALCWVCAAMFIVMAIVNSWLVVKVGRAYRAAQSAYASGQPPAPYTDPYAVQMGVIPQPGPYGAQPYGAPPPGYGAQPYGAPPPAYGVPAGYPPVGTPGGYPVAGTSAAAGYPQAAPAAGANGDFLPPAGSAGPSSKV